MGRSDTQMDLPSPPATENFETIPVITKGPYDFGNKEART